MYLEEERQLFKELYELLEAGKYVPEELKARAESHGIRVWALIETVEALGDNYDDE